MLELKQSLLMQIRQQGFQPILGANDVYDKRILYEWRRVCKIFQINKNISNGKNKCSLAKYMV